MVTWRRRALEQQLPDARFPGGIRTPGRVGLIGLTLTVIMVGIAFAMTGGKEVSGAVVDTQANLVRHFTRALELDTDRSASGLAERADAAEAAPVADQNALVDGLAKPDSGWLGAMVLTPDRKVSVARGQAFEVPATADPARRTVEGRFVNGEPRLVACVPFGKRQVLCGMQPLHAGSLRLNPQAQHGISVGLATGETLLLQGVDQTAEGDRASIRAALAQAREATGTVTVRGGTDANGKQLVATGRSVGDTGLVAVSTIRELPVSGGGPLRGLIPMALLALVVIAGAMWTRFKLTEPMRRLLTQAKADASGEPGRRKALTAPWEVARVSAALADKPLPRKTFPVLVHLVVVCLLSVGWSAAMVFYYGRQHVAVPAQVISDEAAGIEATSTALGSSLAAGLEQVTKLGGEVSGKPESVTKSAFERLLSHENRFRGLYLIDASGKAVVSVGREALRTPSPVQGEGGVRLDAARDRMPVIYAYRANVGKNSVVAEFDVAHLTGLLRAMDGEVKVVDTELHTILDTEGFVAFQELSGGRQRELAMGSLAGQISTEVIHTGGSEVGGKRLVSSASLGGPEPVAALKWATISERQLTTLDLPQTMRYRAAFLAAGMATFIALFTLGWQYFALVRPLGALAHEADSINEFVFDRPILLHRHDEIGAVAACLEVCRQVAQHGGIRLGGAVRLRGFGSDVTGVMPVIDRKTVKQLSTARER